MQKAILKLDKATQSYIQRTGRKAKPILVVIVHRADFTDSQLADLENFMSNNFTEATKITLGVIFFDQLEHLTKKQIIDLLNKD